MTESEFKPNVRTSVWPVAIVTFGLSLSAVWVGLLGYGLFRLLERAM